MKSNRGFSLLETLLYIAIFAIVGGSLFGILTNMVRVTTREVSGDEVSSQLQFAMGTITRLVKDSSAIEMATSTATTTIKLRMTNSAQDPTCISVVGGVLKLAQGPDPFNKQNCVSTTTDITTNKVVVDSASFKRVEFPGGHDQLAIDIQLSNTATGANKISRALHSGISRASAATFDSDLLPNADATYEVGSSISGGKRWKNGSFSGNLTVSGNAGIGTTNPLLAKLQVEGGDAYTTGALGFYVPGEGGARNAMYRGGTDFTILRNYNQLYTLMQVWSPPGALGSATAKEATIALVRGDEPNQEYIDIYNNGYSSETQFGVRIQKRGTGVYRDFVFDQSDGTTKTPIMVLKANGNVGIGTTGLTYKLEVNGNAANTTGVWATLSDQRLKRDIAPITGALQTVTQLQGVGFNWRDDKKNTQLGRVMGFVAQDVEKVLPQWVKMDKDGYKRIETIGMDALLVESIKEQQKQIEGQKNDIDRLQKEIDAIKLGK